MAEALDRDEISQMYRARKTMLKMMQKRGYEVSQSEDAESQQINWTLEQFVHHFESRNEPITRPGMDFVCARSDDPSNTMIVFFHDSDSKVSKKDIVYYVSKMQELNSDCAILVSRGDLSPQGRELMQQMASAKFSFEHFKEEDVLVDITEHTLVPEHKVLTTKEKKQLLDRYKLKPEQLPRILPEDPIARYFGLRRFQVVKIIRPSETAGRYVTYRICR